VSLDHRRYVRQEHAKKDKEQTVFFKDATGETNFKGNPRTWATFTERGIDPFKDVTCPFCLGLNKLRLFLISTKKGYDRGRGKCPLCDQGIKLQTLINMSSWTPEQYAAFVFDYRRSGFWQKIQFSTWKKRLGMMGWTRQFWDEYKKLKGESSDESYVDMTNRLGEEDAERARSEYEETIEA
jgi:hypothetical protein